jgi:GNAT superfamily N-acetyltransferase
MDFLLRTATNDDLRLLAQLRLDYLVEDWGYVDPGQREAIEASLASWLPSHLADGSLQAFIAESDGNVAATAWLVTYDYPAGPAALNGRMGTVYNVLTYPQYRRQGAATLVMRRLLAHARELGVAKVTLEATEAGRPVYEKLGFSAASRLTGMSISLQ